MWHKTELKLSIGTKQIDERGRVRNWRTLSHESILFMHIKLSLSNLAPGV